MMYILSFNKVFEENNCFVMHCFFSYLFSMLFADFSDWSYFTLVFVYVVGWFLTEGGCFAINLNISLSFVLKKIQMMESCH